MKGMVRPVAVVVPDSAVLEPQVITPPPNRFTHVVTERQPYSVSEKPGGPPAGDLPAGAKVVLIARGRGDACRVIDRKGRYIQTSFRGLRPLRYSAKGQ